MTTHCIAEAWVAAILEGEDPKDFIRRHLPDIEREKGINRVGAFELEDIGIEHSQYFTGRGTSYTDWDDVYVGIGDNPHEAIEDALEAAATAGWLVNDIDTSTWPETPSVSDQLEEEAKSSAASQLDRENYEDDESYNEAVEELASEILSDGESELYYHAAVYLREPKEGEAHHTVAEAEDPKAFLKRMSEQPPAPSTWPPFKRWTSTRWGKDKRRGFYMAKRYRPKRDEAGELVRDAEGTLVYEPMEFRKGLKQTRFYRDKARREHSVEYYNTDILTWDQYGNVKVTHGGHNTVTTRERINTFLPFNWRLMTYHGTWYWYNHDWPENIRDRLMSDQTARRTPNFPWWIPFNWYDTIRPDGTLIFGDSRDPAAKKGLAKPDGRLKLEIWTEVRPPPEGMLHPPRRNRRRNAYDPNQLMFQMEGRYMQRLARWKRIQAKHERIKDVDKLKREIEKVDEPDKKKKKKKGHQNLR